MTSTHPGNSRRASIIALLIYLAGAVVITSATWRDPGVRWAGLGGDPAKFIEFLGWFPHAIGQGQNPFFNGSIDVPQGTNMMWDTTMFVPSLASWPVAVVFGPIVAYNILFTLALALGGWCSFLWLRRHVHNQLAAFIGGLLLLGGPYTTAHALGHLNLLLFAPIPLLLMAFEELFVVQKIRPLRLGILIGVLTAVLLLCAEELVALTGLMVGIGLFVAVCLRPREVIRRAGYVARTGAVALIAFLVLAGYPLAYQFFGPYAVQGHIQQFNVYVSDLVNLVVPGPLQAITFPHITDSQAVLWTGNVAEQSAYIGVGLLLIAVYTAVRWWRDVFVRVVALSTLALVVLSLGPHLHIGGSDTGIRLPFAVFSHIPVLNNLLPGRLSLMATFGLAALLAIAIDRSIATVGDHMRWPVIVVAVIGVVSLTPSLAPTTSVNIPAYFSSTGDVQQLPKGTVALLYPYADGSSPDAMAWQAVAGYRFSMVGGVAIVPDPKTGKGRFDLNNPFQTALHPIWQTGVPLPRTAMQLAELRSELARDHVSVVIASANAPYVKQAAGFISWMTGTEGKYGQGVIVWKVAPSGQSAA